MPINITPIAPATFPTSLTCPADGDLANAASVNGAFQSIMTGIEVARQGLYGRKLNARYRVTFPNVGPPPFGPLMVLEPLGQIYLTTGGGTVWRCVNHNVQTSIDLVAKFGGPLTAKTRFYVYATIVAGVLDFVVDTNPPGIDLRYANANTDRAYVGTFLTSAIASNVWGFTCDGRLYRYTLNNGFSIVAGGQANAYTALNAYTTVGDGQIVPAYARNLLLSWNAINNAAGPDTLFINSNNSGGAFEVSIGPSGENFGRPAGIIPAMADDLTNVYYKWTTGGVNVGANIGVVGFYCGE